MSSGDIIVRIVGEGGEGIISAGSLTADAAAREGFNVLTFKTFPATIKGGYALSQIRISSEKILSQGDGFHILVAFNKEGLELNRSLLKEGTVLVYDGPGGDIEEAGDLPGVTVYSVPMSKIAKVDLKNYRAKNMVALGAIAELFSIPIKGFDSKIREKFAGKGEDIVENNLIGFNAGRDYVRENIKKVDKYNITGVEKKDLILLNGNDAIGFGALLAGCNFFSCYPLTPATEIAIWLAKFLPKTNGTLIQAEDEIAAIGHMIGASFAGAKVMSAISGPALSLMIELLGLASIAEIPLVLADVQRGGPSTGMPTKHEQSDLFMAVYGGHGDMPRIVVSPENVEECVTLTIKAFNLAEKYQMPVIILSDGSLGMRTETMERPDPSKIEIVNRLRAKKGDECGERFKRYKFTESGISPVSIPGEEGLAHWITGLEHSEKGAPQTTPENRALMMEKRFSKLKNIEDDLPPEEPDGIEGAEIGIISWGSTQGSVREAVERLRAKGVKVSALYPKLIYPLPVKAIEKFAKGLKKVLVPEVNYQGQFADLIASKTSVKPIKQNIYSGLPFNPEEIEKKVEEILQ
ncbi:MAG: 2-oxoacid:acceptor oxidoreductase subunit alpha [Nitrospinota bacterium]|nr:2-oxoacid:acceptor oxidoreductase subunit alpha [Nitrospinota bacterium]